MRLDLFLKRTALIKRRTIAKEIVEKGHTFINDKVAKPSSNVSNNDIITLHLGTRKVILKAIIEIKNNKEVVNYESIETSKE